MRTETQPTFSSSLSQAASQSLGFSSGGNPAATASNAASPKAEAPSATPTSPLLVILLPPPITKSSAAPHCAALPPAAAALQQHDTSKLSALLLNALPPRSHALEAADACLSPVDRTGISTFIRHGRVGWDGEGRSERGYLRGGGAARQRMTVLQPWTAPQEEERGRWWGGTRGRGRGGLKSG